METADLKRFAQYARRTLLEQVSSRLVVVLMPESAARRENANAIYELEKQLKEHGQDSVIDKVAYTWFNRFCALRFMDVNDYNPIRVVSPLDGQTQPELLAEAKMGHIDERMVQEASQQKIYALLEGRTPSTDPQQEAYRLLLVAACNYWQPAMPFLFERIADYTELLMPDDLLSPNSLLAATREAMTADVCQDVEVIGWLYQFYISEKKDAVFDGLKKNKKIEPEHIPAATQLFTPHWIVRYLVENSLGRLWLLNRPHSKLAAQMDYYIAPTQPETDFLVVASPEELKVCDPACGSGHMLTYAFDLLYAIYEEAGYDSNEIPQHILTKNLFGIEIDERAAALAAFALTMKARAKQKRFLTKKIQPSICQLKPIAFEPRELDEYIEVMGADVFTANVRTLLTQFEEADNFGSLIRPVAVDVAKVRAVLLAKGVGGLLLLEGVHRDVLCVLEQAEFLQQRYQVVVANPPYMGGKGMNGELAAFLKDEYADVKSDLFSAFVVRCAELGLLSGYIGIMCPNVWMYIQAYEELREFITSKKTMTNLVELPLAGFKGATVQICAYNFINKFIPNLDGGFIRLIGLKGGDLELSEYTKIAVRNRLRKFFYEASSSDFSKIPSSPIAYWVSQKLVENFSNSISNIRTLSQAEGKNVTTDNSKYTRFWWEVWSNDFGGKSKKWFPFATGGAFRKWFGNNINIVDWDDSARTFYKKSPAGRIIREEFWYLEGITWSKITSSKASFRILLKEQTYQEVAILVKENMSDNLGLMLGLLNSKVSDSILAALAPTLNYQLEDILRMPLQPVENSSELVDKLIFNSKSDWDSYETSWDFTTFPLLQNNYHQPSIQTTYSQLRHHWQTITQEMQRLEQENNRIFIEAYGLQDELTPDVPLKEITLTCNPQYRYGGDKTPSELEEKLQTDTIKEFISYAVGCMFGRYSLDQAGLVLANQGQTLADYLQQIPEPRFMPDEDNVIPILDGDWFSDDITERFKTFLKVSFSRDTFEENLRFIEDALGKKGKPQTIRDYFLKDFYPDHIKRYKKRPIYWLFSSPKGSFNALVSMHRYRPDTVSIVLNDYLREFRTKLTAHKSYLEQISISSSAGQSEKTKALKDIETLKKTLTELNDYEHDVLYPLATKQLAIDLDDGVKVNYLKFGTALKKIVGLDAAGDD